MTQRRGNSPFGNSQMLTGIIVLVLGFIAMYWIAYSIFNILSWLAPFLLVGALLINYKVVLDFGKMLFKLLKENPLIGIVGIALTAFGFPIVSGFLFGKALLTRKISNMQQDARAAMEYSEYEEVTDEEYLELKDVEQIKEEPKSNDYENLI